MLKTLSFSLFSLCFTDCPNTFFFFFLKYFLLFLVVVCQLGPSGAIFPEFHSTAFLFKNILQNFFNTFLCSPCSGHSTMVTLLQTGFWWAEHVGMRLSAGTQAIVWIMDTDIHPLHMLGSAELWCSKHCFAAGTMAAFQNSSGRLDGSAGILRNSHTSTSWEYMWSKSPWEDCVMYW